jgi:hypothetical protein
VRFYKRDTADNALEFIGADRIDHTLPNEDLALNVGRPFDIVGERKRPEFHLDRGRQIMQESFEILLRNHKDAAVEVIIEEI